METKLSHLIEKLFHSNKNGKNFGIKTLKYRIVKIMEPIFLSAFLIISGFDYYLLIRQQNVKLLIIILILQLILVCFYIFFIRQIVDRIFFGFLAFYFALSFLFHILNMTMFSWLLISVLLSSIIFGVKRTLLITLFMMCNLIYQKFNISNGVIIKPMEPEVWNSVFLFTIITGLSIGPVVSVIIFFLEKSYLNLYLLEQNLEEKSIKLIQEVEKKRQIEVELKGNELKFKTIIEHGFDGITIVDKNGNAKFISNSTERITGYSSEEFQDGAITFDRIHPDDMQRVIENFRSISEHQFEHSIIYYRYLHKNGEWRNLEVSVTNLLENPGINGILFVYRDITKHIKAEQRARYFEYYDKLTDLPNQLMFSEKIAQEIERSSARNRAFAVMCLGINSFKNINEEFGTSFGDMVLKQIGSRLKSNFRGDDFVSRMMGDKFLILFSDMKSENDVVAIVLKTMDGFEKSFWIENRDISISVCIGISIYPQDGEKKDILIKNSETALFICKENRESKYSLYNKDQNNELIFRIQIEKEINKAIENKAFTVYYQPKVDNKGEIVGAEALIRWFSPERGMVSPGIFIPISERNRSIIQIGEIVIDKVFFDMHEWLEKGYSPIKISINVAPLQFSDSNFIKTVIDLQNKYRINSEFVEFEVTETGIMENEKKTVEVMKEITTLGYSISIDDFGTGYSSLSKLKDYPVKSLKIDKSFIDPIPVDSSSSNIVKTIIDLAHYLDYEVIAEGVELKEQVDFLHNYHCDLIQGYYYYKPMPQNQFVKLIDEK